MRIPPVRSILRLALLGILLIGAYSAVVLALFWTAKQQHEHNPELTTYI